MGAQTAHELGLQVNAGHGITVDNIGGILCIPHLSMLNIGHSLVSRAVSGYAEGGRGDAFGNC